LVRNEDGSINRCATPAKPGSIVTIYINGGGSPNASVDESQIAQQKTHVNVPVIVLDGTQSLEVRNVSLEPGAPVGVWRVDFRLGNNPAHGNWTSLSTDCRSPKNVYSFLCGREVSGCDKISLLHP
jgi:uncharacterized protein (TIGR03437 family)